MRIEDGSPLEEPGRSLALELHVETETRYADDTTGPEPLAAGADLSPGDLAPPGGRFVVVIDDDGDAVGCGGIRHHADGIAEIKRMYVRPAARARGISRLILHELEESARRLGYATIVLETGLRQPEAMALYESSGYTRIPPFGYWRESELSVCYRKDLP